MKRIYTSLRKSNAVVGMRAKIPNWLVNKAWHLPKAVLANFLLGFPAKKIKVIAITGTKGKTSTAHLIFHILKKQKKRVVLISTILAKFGEREIDIGLHVTNPSSFQLQKLLKKAKNEKYEFVVLEVTSHGLDQYRNWGIQFELGVYTQVEADHTSYHGGVEEYRKAKAILIKNSKKVILNYHDPSLKYLTQQAKSQQVPISIYRGKEGDFQSQNIRAAIAVALELGISENKARKAIESFSGVPGRMEIIKDEPFRLVIDFAHTPESLQAALNYLRPMVKKNSRLIAVFGCAGERDPQRRKMGMVAAKLSDFFIITAEDPRTEGVEKISEEIASFALKEGARELPRATVERKEIKKNLKGANFTRITDRFDAIKTAITIAKPGDVVGLFGKGHEKSMCFGKTEHPWSEHEAVKKAANMKG